MIHGRQPGCSTVIIEGLTELKNGRGDKLLEINDLFGGRTPGGEWSNQTEANMAINCMDEDRRTPEQEAQLRKDIEQVGPFVATGSDHDGVRRDTCEF
ncbi:hypothetical protein [Rhodococcus sp. NPDC058521]|uniref:hypothetical protein n=1 Tax=Rhodococcus sp. NPDC058521 TaxID=3346536 RepID=UPI00364E3E5A